MLMTTNLSRRRGGARPTLSALLAVMLSACGGGGGGNQAGTGSGGGSGGGPMPSSFTLASTSPEDESNQKADFPVVAVFSAPVDESSVDSTTFSVTAGVNPVPGSFRFSDDGSVVIFTPDSDLVDNQDYTVTVGAGVKSATGDELADAQTWGFTASATANYGCTITAPPAGLNLNSAQRAFYTQYCDAGGLPVMGDSNVPPAALQEAWREVTNMLKMRQDLLAEMVNNGTIVAVKADGEGITSIPAYSDLDTVSPLPGGESWDARAAGGLGATMYRPTSSGSEENLLCYATDPYFGEDIFLHEFSHSVALMGLATLQPAFLDKLDSAYQDALSAGRFANTYADDTAQEYWAEGVQDWFNVNLQSDPPDGIHNTINTRSELKSYDPALYSLISQVFTADFQPTCPPH